MVVAVAVLAAPAALVALVVPVAVRAGAAASVSLQSLAFFLIIRISSGYRSTSPPRARSCRAAAPV
jgi:hypothetical protein